MNEYKSPNWKELFSRPSFESLKTETPTFEFRDPDLVTKEILGFLTSQSETAEKQFKTSRNLILSTIVIMILQIGYAVWTNSESNSIQNNLTKIIDKQSQQSEVVSRMSLNLLDLQNQVRTLERENARLNLKTEK